MSLRFASQFARRAPTIASRFQAAPAVSRAFPTGFRALSSTTLPQKPTIEEAKACPRQFYEMSNDMIIRLSAEGIFEAIEERLVRDIMSVDECEWDVARSKFEEISAKNQEGMFLQTVPYYAGISVGLVGAFGSIPLCFELNTVHWFNEHYVTTEIPPPEDLETWLEVGSWAWNWMEPPLGQVSFFLLALQFARAQMENLGIKPYTAMMKSRRADKLVGAFPAYCPNLLRDFSKAQSLIG
ncbi:hypothetical protein TrST_g9623 [Triparma strigata]|uniref:Uncharacterized protein n=1 Tax=Triparma strigata TaxID=1606541 RepID=A0A9W7DX59_9STRA|nr:hypothetical protein TrST_g9623 [Triparma strigata]